MIAFSLAAVSRARLAAALFAEAGKVVAKIPFLMVRYLRLYGSRDVSYRKIQLQAFWMYIALLGIWGVWVVSVAFLATAGKLEVDGLTGFVTTSNIDFWWAYLIQIFGIIWLTEVVTACHQFMLSAATARYYFYRDKSQFDRGKVFLYNDRTSL